jgi:hypothetical protein
MDNGIKVVIKLILLFVVLGAGILLIGQFGGCD